MTRRSRRAAYQHGLSAESRAALWLRLKGYRILARRHKTPVGEIDLIARRGKTVAFVEVKARESREAALEAITPQTQRRIVEAAHLWLARNPRHMNHTLRFDAVLVTPRQIPRHIANAWKTPR
ncbi:YraN family protein [Breoghania sp.]|uniref:YraN family protein n=1 Tax=Breoghania sp. TaxID=2065378 RepID=UPI002625A113|nr:YraN family protein [Breoghania sp.]MDJ0930396.1 YraN family protein [Breoghania sp.]